MPSRPFPVGCPYVARRSLRNLKRIALRLIKTGLNRGKLKACFKTRFISPPEFPEHMIVAAVTIPPANNRSPRREMEAFAAVPVALQTICDMCKPFARHDVHVVEMHGK